MDLRVRRKRDETYEELRVRMIAETSAYLTECLKHPEFAVHIPMVPADSNRFPPSFSMSFWDPVLLD
jgi:hypothetical protein